MFPVRRTESAVCACSEQTGWEFIEVYRGLHEGPFEIAPMELEAGGCTSPMEQIPPVDYHPAHDDFSPGKSFCRFSRAGMLSKLLLESSIRRCIFLPSFPLRG